MIYRLVLIAFAGALGTLARYGISGVVQKVNGEQYPWGTLAVNIIGSFVVGALWVLFERHWDVSNEVKTMILVGFMGAFTTFSTFILETSHFLRSSGWIPAIANVALQPALGLLALFAGMYMTKFLL